MGNQQRQVSAPVPEKIFLVVRQKCYIRPERKNAKDQNSLAFYPGPVQPPRTNSSQWTYHF